MKCGSRRGRTHREASGLRISCATLLHRRGRRASIRARIASPRAMLLGRCARANDARSRSRSRLDRPARVGTLILDREHRRLRIEPGPCRTRPGRRSGRSQSRAAHSSDPGSPPPSSRRPAEPAAPLARPSRAPLPGALTGEPVPAPVPRPEPRLAVCRSPRWHRPSAPTRSRPPQPLPRATAPSLGPNSRRCGNGGELDREIAWSGCPWPPVQGQALVSRCSRRAVIWAFSIASPAWPARFEQLDFVPDLAAGGGGRRR